jgi:hypothetical protein
MVTCMHTSLQGSVMYVCMPMDAEPVLEMLGPYEKNDGCM